MKQLIELQIVPAQIELKRTEAKIEYVNGEVSQKINRTEGSMRVTTKPAKVHTDTYQCRSSMGPGFMNVKDNIQSYANKGMSDALSSTAKYASRGQQLLKTQRGEELITRFARQDHYENVKMNIGIDFVPSVAPKVTVEPGDIQVDIEPSRMEIDWMVKDHQLHFTPASIEVELVQRPDVIVRYVGGYNYVPQASDPNYSG